MNDSYLLPPSLYLFGNYSIRHSIFLKNLTRRLPLGQGYCQAIFHGNCHSSLIRYLLQRSCLQQLEKGKMYYIEALHSNYVDNDHVRIHVKFPGSNTARSLDIEHLFLYSPGEALKLKKGSTFCNVTSTRTIPAMSRSMFRLLLESPVILNLDCFPNNWGGEQAELNTRLALR